MIRFLLLIFIAAFTSVSFGQTIRELEQELEGILRDKHGYQGNGFSSGSFSPPDPEAYLEGLRKFKEALGHTQNIRSFKRVGTIFISSLTKKNDTFERSDGQTSFYFPVSAPSPAFIGLISSNPSGEPVYQGYLKESQLRQDRLLKEGLGKWFKLHKVGQQILCDHGGVSSDKDKIKRLAEKLSGGFGVKEVKYRQLDASDAGDYNKNIDIVLNSSPPLEISITTYVRGGIEEISYVEVTKKRRGSSFRSKKLSVARFDSDCDLMSGEVWEYNDRGTLSRRLWLDETGEVSRTVYANRAVKSLKEVYDHCDYPRPLDELQEVANRTDRILVTILDNGVDYNHPDLAFKIPGPSNNKNPPDESRSETVSRQRERLKQEKRDLQDEYDGFGALKKAWYKGEYNSRLKNINDEIAQNAVGWDFEDDDDEPYDYFDYALNISESFDHGTHVAGIAARGSDDISILPIRSSKSKVKKFYDSIEYAHKKGSRIVNVSLGSEAQSAFKPLSDAIHDHPDMLFVVAAGNTGNNLDDSPYYPAEYEHPNMLVVASVDENNDLSYFSNYSKTKVDVAAPGEDIDSPTPENTRGKNSGTSMAAPYVTRVAAKVKFINPELTPRQVISIIRDSVTPVDDLQFKVKYGGVVNEEKALEIAKGTLNVN